MLDHFRDMPVGRILGWAAAIGLLFFIVWVGLIGFFWALGFHTVAGDFWSAVEGLSSAATLATIIGGGIMAYLQLVESVEARDRELESRNLEVYNYIFERLTSEDNINARRWIYVNLTGDPAVDLPAIQEHGMRSYKLILDSLDHLGFLIQQDWITSEAIIHWVSPFVVKLWEKIGPTVEYQAEQRNEPDYYEAAKYLAEKCIEHRQKDVQAAYRWIEGAV